MDGRMRVDRRPRPPGPDVLVITPEPETQACLATDLRLGGYRSRFVSSGAAGLDLLGSRRFALIVVDSDTHDLNRLSGQVDEHLDRPPVLCLTGCDNLVDLLPVLGTRVEDYVIKPCRGAEFLARVQVVLRGRGRADATTDPLPDLLRCGDLVLDASTGTARRGGRTLEVTPAEFRLLQVLLRNPDQVLSKEQLARHVWGDRREGNTIERLVSRLRQKVDRTDPDMIVTHRGLGYRLRPGT